HPLEHREEGRPLRVWRRAALEPGVWHAGESLTQVVDEARLPHSCLAHEQHVLALALRRPLPAFDEGTQFHGAPDKTRQPPRRRRGGGGAPAAGGGRAVGGPPPRPPFGGRGAGPPPQKTPPPRAAAWPP